MRNCNKKMGSCPKIMVGDFPVKGKFEGAGTSFEAVLPPNLHPRRRVVPFGSQQKMHSDFAWRDLQCTWTLRPPTGKCDYGGEFQPFWFQRGHRNFGVQSLTKQEAFSWWSIQVSSQLDPKRQRRSKTSARWLVSVPWVVLQPTASLHPEPKTWWCQICVAPPKEAASTPCGLSPPRPTRSCWSVGPEARS